MFIEKIGRSEWCDSGWSRISYTRCCFYKHV